MAGGRQVTSFFRPHTTSSEQQLSLGEGEVASVSSLPWLHPQIDTKDLRSNGLLLSEEQIACIKKEIDGSQDVSLRFPKSVLNAEYLKEAGEAFRFTVMVLEGKVYFVYHGAKKGKSVGAGSFWIDKAGTKRRWCMGII
jgi:hypothetical protein